jgi:mannonate dehydratase
MCNFTQRIFAVSAIDECMALLLIGKDPTRIEDIWQSGGERLLA